MSDKGFGDQHNRNIVKNPLLSTAVTGLSLEDLTHNAVLLPVVPSRGMIPSQDNQIGTQTQTLRNPEHNTRNLPSGDTFNIQKQSIDSIQKPLSHLGNQNTETNRNDPNITVSKASQKSEDDFDVNEYFARLQGTRYVSAPLNSQIKEEPNQNLETTEENLEEINLNDNDKSLEEVQHSLTADIAQNFSQLPTVLPQVASAVFSSFSNMLSMKSREQTPDERVYKEPCAEVLNPHQSESIDVPLMGVENYATSREVPPPPKEPPQMGGTGNFRITTKKKAYAQIPGLSSREAATAPSYNVPPRSHMMPSTSHNITNYFTPSLDNTDNSKSLETNLPLEVQNRPQTNITPAQTFSFYNPNSYNSTVTQAVTDPIASVAPPVNDEIFFKPITEERNDSIITQTIQYNASSQEANAAIIPPPPMFSNLPRKESQASVGKSILPPSVARRLTSNQPVVKQNLPPLPNFVDNIFTPASVTETILEPVYNKAPVAFTNENTSIPFAHTGTNITSMISVENNHNKEEKQIEPPIFGQDNLSSTMSNVSIAPPPIGKISTLQSTGLNTRNAQTAVPLSNAPFSAEASKQPTPPTFFNPNSFQDPMINASKPQIQASYAPTPGVGSCNQTPAFAGSTAFEMNMTNITPGYNLPPSISVSVLPPSSITPSNLQQSSLPPPTTFANPTTQISPEMKTVSNTEPPKIPLPPKNVGNQSYRLAKKRPQYYSGPIEGMGAISYNVKPVLPPNDTPAYPGALFTPEQAALTSPVAQLAPDSQTIPDNTPPFDISQPTQIMPPFSDYQQNTPQEHQFSLSNYDTSFDLSRQTTDLYEAPKEEQLTGLGLLGSLKSKLSAIDINKLQDKVTTFFDPAYNNTKLVTDSQENYSYQTLSQQPSYFGATQDQSSHLNIYVPGTQERSQVYPQRQGYSIDHYSQNPNAYLQNYPSSPQTTGYVSNQMHQNTYQFGNVQSNVEVYQQSVPNIQPPIGYSDATFPNNAYSGFDSTSIAAENAFNQTSNIQPAAYNPYDDDLPRKHEPNFSGAEEAVSALKSEYQPEALMSIGVSPNVQQTISQANTIFSANSNKSVAFGEFRKDTISQSATNINPPVPAQVASSRANVNTTETKISAHPESSLAKPDLISPASSLINKNVPLGESNQTIHKAEDMLHSFSNFKISEDTVTEDHYVLRDSELENKNISEPVQQQNNLTAASFFDAVPIKTENETQNNTIKLFQPEHSNINVLSKSLFDLSNVIADQTKTDKYILDNISKDLTTTESHTHAEGSTFAKEHTLTKTASDLSICETCREVSKPDEKDPKEVEDLTSQLIENITSPIQLSNPVEAPLTVFNTPGDVNIKTNTEQLDEITHITEDTFETIQVQSAVELLDEPVPCTAAQLQFGWTSNDDDTSTCNYQKHIHGLDVDPNAIGLFSKSLFSDVPANASDEIKAEYKFTADDLTDIPSAPQFEDDAKSDETGGLDVHSIEQDAKKDFPEFDTEEFVIEPSETDDDKIEFRDSRRESSADNVEEIDSFTNRVERFKKMEEHNHEANELIAETRRSSQIFDPAVATSPALTIASYFDTGNYAVETHYRNSISSPSNLSSFSVGSPNVPMRIPPGFEEEFKRRLSGLSSVESFTPYLTKSETLSVETNIKNTKQIETFENTIESKIQSAIQPPNTNQDTLSPEEAFGIPKSIIEPISSFDIQTDNLVKLPQFSEAFGNKLETKDNLKEVVPKETTQAVVPGSLPDPINFFASPSIPDTRKEETPDKSFNRLASYFSSPAKTEPNKPFFELSQSQDHYRQEIKPSTDNLTYFNYHLVNQKTYNRNIYNIPQEQFLANLRLMEDLTSYRNIEINNPDQIVRKVNYFTVEYVSCNLNLNPLKTVEKNANEKTDQIKIIPNVTPRDEPEESASNPETVVEKCTYCCDFSVGPIVNLDKIDFNNIPAEDLKLKKTMDQEDKGSSSSSGGNLSPEKSERKAITINLGDDAIDPENNENVAILNENRLTSEYTPVKYHWFYRVDFEGKSAWKGFSVSDSKALEDALNSPDLNENTTVATDGGRFDVNVMGRLRVPVYWSDKPTNVRRCSWFVKGTTSARYVPYTESAADKLEEEYRLGVTTGVWHRRLMLPNNECVVMHGPTVMAHLVNAPQSDAFTQPPMIFFNKRVYRNPPKLRVSTDYVEKVDHLVFMVHGAGEFRKQMDRLQSIMRPRPVHRGYAESEIEDAEPSNIDHLLLLCHGVGSACDMRFRSVEEVVDDFRSTSHQLLQAHYKNSYDSGIVGRVEVLPISWHKTLHAGDKGVDQRLAQITLDSIPKLRNFTNDTVLDVLFYTSPVYCQTIIDTVCGELNRIYRLFKARNPHFTGGVSLGGHSLGSVILYDLLCHQPQNQAAETANKLYINGNASPGYPNVVYPVLDFVPEATYAMGSPIAIFECIRGVENLGLTFALPTCRNFFNIFHPYDPIAYRIEPLINPALKDVKPSLIPHHKGRKRMHLELKDTMARVGADIKQKLLESIRSTWASVWKTQPPPNDSALEKVVEEEMEKGGLNDEPPKEKPDAPDNIKVTPEMLGRLNAGRRVDYVLQEAPFELINEYIFAMSSHVCYWESEDTMLLILREIYEALGIRPDSTVPQQTMIVERTRIKEDNSLASDQPSTSRDD